MTHTYRHNEFGIWIKQHTNLEKHKWHTESCKSKEKKQVNVSKEIHYPQNIKHKHHPNIDHV